MTDERRAWFEGVQYFLMMLDTFAAGSPSAGEKAAIARGIATVREVLKLGPESPSAQPPPEGADELVRTCGICRNSYDACDCAKTGRR